MRGHRESRRERHSSPIIDFTGYRHNEMTAPSVISLFWVGSRRWWVWSASGQGVAD